MQGSRGLLWTKKKQGCGESALTSNKDEERREEDETKTHRERQRESQKVKDDDAEDDRLDF